MGVPSIAVILRILVLTKGYSELMELADAIVAAIKTCISKGILLSFLEEHATEVLNMLFTEWNLEDAIAVAKEELFALWESGVPLAEAKKKFGLD